LKYRKIHIIGAPGSGKTYVASKLATLTNIKAHELDKVFWCQAEVAYVRSSEEERTTKLNDILTKEDWIVEGVYYKWLASAFDAADIIIVLNPSVLVRQWRITKRFLIRKFIQGEFQKETFSSFLTLFWWNQKFDSDNMQRILAFTAEHKTKVIFCNDCDVKWSSKTGHLVRGF